MSCFPTALMLFLWLILLKISGHIDWSWWWVSSPILIGLFVECYFD